MTDNLNKRIAEFKESTFNDKQLDQKNENIRGFFAAVVAGDDECAQEFSKYISKDIDIFNITYPCSNAGGEKKTLLNQLWFNLFITPTSFDHVKICNILCLLNAMGAKGIGAIGLTYQQESDVRQFIQNPELFSAMIACALAAGGKPSSNLQLKKLFPPGMRQAKQLFILGESIQNLENDIELMPNSEKNTAKALVKKLRENIPLLITQPVEARKNYKKLLKEGNALFKISNAPWWYAVRKNLILVFATLGLGYLIAGLVHLAITRGKYFAFFTPAEKIEETVKDIAPKKQPKNRG